MALRDNLYRLRCETQDAFNEAKALEGRWKDLEREQREVYQVCVVCLLAQSHILTRSSAVHAPIPSNASPPCNNSARR
jgi:hypothetical protein